GEVDGADVVLGDPQRRLAVAQQVGEGAAVGLDARRTRGHGAVDDAVLVDDAREIHLRQRLDDAGAAYASDADLLGRFGETRLVRPFLACDDADTRFERLAIHSHALHGA